MMMIIMMMIIIIMIKRRRTIIIMKIYVQLSTVKWLNDKCKVTVKDYKMKSILKVS